MQWGGACHAVGWSRAARTLVRMGDRSTQASGRDGGEPPTPASSAVVLTSGLGETVLPDEVPDVVDRLADAAGAVGPGRREAVAAVVRDHPRSSLAWAELAAAARDDVEAYACYRVGYHRGLDALRAAGWRGSGFVTSVHPSNRGFLRCLEGLAAMPAAIGEDDEAERCRVFLSQLDPAGPNHEDGPNHEEQPDASGA